MAQLEAAQRQVEAASEAAAGSATTLESEREAARVQAAAAAAELEMVETAAEEAAKAADAANARADAAEVAKNAALSAGPLHHRPLLPNPWSHRSRTSKRDRLSVRVLGF
jgi:hypothetical protein